MEISRHLWVGETISYAKDEIVSAIEKKEYPNKLNWYAITSTYEKENLFYIISGTEYRHPLYHRDQMKTSDSDHSMKEALKLFGIAGSKQEAYGMVRDFLLDLLESDQFRNVKEILNEW